MTQKIDKELTQRLRTWLEGGTAPPYKFDIFFTNKCNLKCRFCNFPNTKDYGKELTDKELLSLIRQAGELGAKVFGVLGGEPFIRKCAIKVMQTAKGCGMAGSVATNGTLLDENKIRALVDMKWDLIRFSVDGSNAQIHDSLRGIKSGFEKTIEAIRLLQKIKEETGCWHPTIELNTVLCKKNIFDIPKIFKLASDLNIKNIYFLPMINLVSNIEDLQIRSEDSKKLLDTLDKTELIKNVSSNIGEIKKDCLFTKSNEIDKVVLSEKKKRQKDYIPCFLPWYSMSINAEGYVTPCGQIELENKVNIRNKPIKEIWFGEHFSKLRKNMLKKIMPEGCHRCCMPLVDENRLLRKELIKNGTKDNTKR